MTAPEYQLRPMEESDLERVLGWRNHPDVRRFMYTQNEIALPDHQRWFARAREDSTRHLLIFEQAGEPTGFVNITQQASLKVADWGFYLAPNSARGIGKRLGEAALRYGFESLTLHKVCGQALAYNESSINFHKKLGFQQEGLLRDQHFDGQQFHSVVCFGLLSEEWQSQSGGNP